MSPDYPPSLPICRLGRHPPEFSPQPCLPRQCPLFEYPTREWFPMTTCVLPASGSPTRNSRSGRGMALLTAAFITLSVLDFLLTRHLLNRPGSLIYEANPIAAHLLAVFGWTGMACYKLACLAVVLG